MHGVSPRDGDRAIDWGKASADYAAFRPGPPPSFYTRLRDVGVGLPGQRVLDLGTGTGVVARQLAAQGAIVCGVDVSAEQIAEARRLGPGIDFRVAPAEATTFPDRSFDVLTANQCWLYFDAPRAIAEARRLLEPPGVLVTSHLSWLPRLDPIARATEALVLRHNSQWSAADWDGVIPRCPAWTLAAFEVSASFVYDEPIAFTREAWRGRIRASRGVGASMSPQEVTRFDEDHDALLGEIAPEQFTVLHRIDAHLFRFR